MRSIKEVHTHRLKGCVIQGVSQSASLPANNNKGGKAYTGGASATPYLTLENTYQPTHHTRNTHPLATSQGKCQ